MCSAIGLYPLQHCSSKYYYLQKITINDAMACMFLSLKISRRKKIKNKRHKNKEEYIIKTKQKERRTKKSRKKDCSQAFYYKK